MNLYRFKCWDLSDLRSAESLRGPWRDFTIRMPPLAQDIIERAGELGITVPGEEPERADPVGKVHS
jgi:hypothetical protein